MKLLKTIDKVLAGFGNMKAMRRNHVDTFTENLIENIKGTKIAESEYGQLFVTYQTISDYDFLNITLLSGTNIKTLKGCDLIFKSESNNITINSDTKEIESDFSNVSNRWITKVSFVINKSSKEMISKRNFEKVLLNYKKKSIPFNKVA